MNKFIPGSNYKKIPIKEKIKKRLDSREPIPKHLWSLIIKKGTLAGSTLFGGFTDTSDYDYILYDIKIQDFSDYFAYDFNDYNEMGFQSYYVKNKNDQIINMLIMNSKKEYIIWKKSTKLMMKLISIPIFKKAFKNKKIRVEMFEILKKIYGKDND